MPHVPPHVPVLMQVTLHAEPQFTLQFGPMMHWNVQPSPHCAVQLLVKPRHVGEQAGAGPHATPQEAASTHEQDEGGHAAPSVPESGGPGGAPPLPASLAAAVTD